MRECDNILELMNSRFSAFSIYFPSPVIHIPYTHENCQTPAPRGANWQNANTPIDDWARELKAIVVRFFDRR